MTIDNYGLFELHEAEQEAWIEKRPLCVCCLNPIQDDYLYDIDGKLYCEDCMRDEFRKCTDNYVKEN